MTGRRAKSEDIKVRVEPRMKLDLEDMAAREQLDVSDIVRRAIRREMVRSQGQRGNQATQRIAA